MNPATVRRNRFRRNWAGKFRDAFRGVGLGIRGQSSFRVHGVAAVVVVILGLALQISRVEWCLLVLCTAVVCVAEMLNSALEWLAKAIDRQENPRIGAALDIGSGAVLLAAIGASVVGIIVFLPRLGVLLRWWG